MSCGWGTFRKRTGFLLNACENHVSVSVCVRHAAALPYVIRDGSVFVTGCSHPVLSAGDVLINVDGFVTVKANDIHSAIHASPIA